MPQDCCFQARKRWENQSSSGNKGSVSVHKLTSCMDCATGCGLQTRKRWENQSSSDNKGSVSVYKLTSCMDCATGCGLQTRKRWENQSSSGQQMGQLVCTNLPLCCLHGLCHRMWSLQARTPPCGKSTKFSSE